MCLDVPCRYLLQRYWFSSIDFLVWRWRDWRALRRIVSIFWRRLKVTFVLRTPIHFLDLSSLHLSFDYILVIDVIKNILVHAHVARENELSDSTPYEKCILKFFMTPDERTILRLDFRVWSQFRKVVCGIELMLSKVSPRTPVYTCSEVSLYTYFLLFSSFCMAEKPGLLPTDDSMQYYVNVGLVVKSIIFFSERVSVIVCN